MAIPVKFLDPNASQIPWKKVYQLQLAQKIQKIPNCKHDGDFYKMSPDPKGQGMRRYYRPHKVGDQVTICDLETQAYNGKTGKLTKFLPKHNRWELTLDNTLPLGWSKHEYQDGRYYYYKEGRGTQ